MKYRAVLFDAGGTLLFLDYARLAAGVGVACGMDLTEAQLRDAVPAATRAMEQGSGSDRDRAGRFLHALFTTAGLPPERWDDARSALGRLHAERHLWSGGDRETPAALERLRAAGVRLGVVSNSDGRVAEALAAAGLAHLFEVIVDSHVAGVEKPDPRIFRIALEALGVDPSEALYVGDLYEVDVIGARAAGLSAALVGAAPRDAPENVAHAASVGALIDTLLTTGTLP